MSTLLRARIAVSAFFMLGGIGISVWAVHIPEILNRLELGAPQLGLVLITLGIGAVLGTLLAGQVADRVGSKTSTAVAGVAFGLSLLLPAYAENLYWLMGSLALSGFCLGVLDGSMNVNGMALEKAYPKRIFSGLHALWSAGNLIGATLGGITQAAGFSAQFTLPAVGISIALASSILTSSLWVDSANQAHTTQTRDERKQADKSNGAHFGLVLLIAFLGVLVGITEGTAADWSALELTKITAASASAAATGLAVFSLGMMVMRFTGDVIVDRMGREWVLRWGSALSAASLLLIAGTTNFYVAVVGWLLLGVGVANLMPQIFARGSEIGEASHSGRNMAVVMGLSYAGTLAGPGIIGWLAAFFDLNIALGLLAAMPIAVWALTNYALNAKV